jgi:tetratricopeptide (TPR) repeat protein
MARGRAAIIAFLLMGAQTGRADQDHARQLFREGSTAFDAGRFREAAVAFEAAYQESKRPKLLWNLATAYRKQYDLDHDIANLRRAKAVFHNYVDLADPGGDRAEAIAADREVGRQIAEIEIDEKRRQAAAPTAPTAPASAPPGSRTPGLVIGGAGVGLALLGLVFAALAADASSTVQNAGRTMPVQFGDYADVESRGRTFDALGWTLVGLGVAAAAAGAVLFVWRPHFGERRPSAAAWLSPSPGGLAVGGRF